MTLGTYIKELREKFGWSKANLAREMGVAWTTVNDWELHGAIPGPQALASLADKFKLTDAGRKMLHDLAGAPQGHPPAPPSTEAPEPVSRPTQAASGERSALEMLLTRSLQPERHALSDAVAVLGVLADASHLVAEFGLSDVAARAWLDSAAWLRARGEKVTAAALAVLVAQRLAAVERVTKRGEDSGDAPHQTGPVLREETPPQKTGPVRRLHRR